MSMTLILWKAPVVSDPADAQRLLEPWYEHRDDSAFESSDDIARAADMLRSRWPDEYDDEPPESCPWADMPFEQSSRLLAVHVRWGADDEAIAAITVVARKLGLVLYDPQGPDVFLPDDPIDPGRLPPPTPFEWFKGVALAAFLCVVTYGTWLIPVWWLRWPAVIVAGFLAGAGLFVVGAMIAGVLGVVDANAGRGTREEKPPSQTSKP